VQIKHIVLISFPLLLATAIVYPLILLTVGKDSRLLCKLGWLSGFLFLSGFVSNVVVPGLNKLTTGKFYNDFGVIGLSERMFISLAIYACIVFALSKSINFRSGKLVLMFIISSSTIFGVIFEFFIKYF
jgi:hypothetical protein